MEFGGRVRILSSSKKLARFAKPHPTNVSYGYFWSRNVLSASGLFPHTKIQSCHHVVPTPKDNNRPWEERLYSLFCSFSTRWHITVKPLTMLSTGALQLQFSLIAMPKYFRVRFNNILYIFDFLCAFLAIPLRLQRGRGPEVYERSLSYVNNPDYRYVVGYKQKARQLQTIQRLNQCQLSLGCSTDGRFCKVFRLGLWTGTGPVQSLKHFLHKNVNYIYTSPLPSANLHWSFISSLLNGDI